MASMVSTTQGIQERKARSQADYFCRSTQSWLFCFIASHLLIVLLGWTCKSHSVMGLYVEGKGTTCKTSTGDLELCVHQWGQTTVPMADNCKPSMLVLTLASLSISAPTFLISNNWPQHSCTFWGTSLFPIHFFSTYTCIHVFPPQWGPFIESGPSLVLFCCMSFPSCPQDKLAQLCLLYMSWERGLLWTQPPSFATTLIWGSSHTSLMVPTFPLLTTSPVCPQPASSTLR